MLRLCALTLAVLASVLAIFWMSFPSRHRGPAYTEEMSRVFEARLAALDSALRVRTTEGDDGLYLRGYPGVDCCVDELRIDREWGFAFQHDMIWGDFNWGPLDRTGDELRLLPTIPLCENRCNSPGEQFRIVRWGARRYLVEPERMDAFVNAVNRGRAVHLRYSFWAREPEGDVPFEGLPALPADVASKLFATPKTGRLVDAKRIDDPMSESPPHCTFELRLDAGKTDGVWIGMACFLSDASSIWTCAVTSVDDASAVAVARCLGRELVHAEPQGGWRWSTRED